ncbi:MAG: AAA family ATPase, partial [Planctomycetota bacterium]
MTDETKRPLKTFALGDSLVPVLRLARAAGIPLLLSGDSGIGKSQFVRDHAAAAGLRLVVLNLALFESPGELLGLPAIEDGVTRYKRPALLPIEGAGILLIEEAARSAPHVMAPFYEFLTSRRLGEYELPPGWSIVACMNPPGPDYDGHPFDRAMRDRFLHLDVAADLLQWLHWAERHRVHPRVLAALRGDARLFFLASPRSWERAAALLRDAEQHGLEPALLEP